MRGTDVLIVQNKLAHLGYAPGPRDGRYGPTTAAAIRSFQGHHKLAIDGIYGPATKKALDEAAAGGGTHPPIVRQPSTHGQQALLEALKHLGSHEQPSGSNRQQFGVWFGVNGVPWCAIFMSYCFVLGSGFTLCAGFHGAGIYRRGVAYVPTLEAWLRATGRWVGKTSPVPGDIAIFNWDGGVADHVGIVERYLGGGKFLSVEGNTAVGNDSNGGEVMRRERYVSQVNGFGRVR